MLKISKHHCQLVQVCSQMCDDTACEYGALVRGECGSSTKYPSTEYVRIGECNRSIALFTVTFSHLHYNVFDRGCEAISANFAVSARNCLTFAFKCIVMQMRKGNCEKGYLMLYSINAYSIQCPIQFNVSFNSVSRGNK